MFPLSPTVQSSPYVANRALALLFLFPLTARMHTEDIIVGFQMGTNVYVTKPVDAVELKVRVNALTKNKLSIAERLHMEGAWLHSQIQRHVIFNTLNSIAALGEIDIAKMQELLEAFSHYLRLSFDFHNTKPVVPLRRIIFSAILFIYRKTRFGIV